MTTLNASRDILSLFMSFRLSNLATTHCRGIDFLALTASIVLSIAHIEARRQRHMGDLSDVTDSSVFKHLPHPRSADRGLLEQAPEIMEATGKQATDDITSNVVKILRQVLDIDGEAAAVEIFNTTLCLRKGLEYVSKLCEDGNSLLIFTPTFGTIKIERCTVFNMASIMGEVHERNPALLSGVSVGREGPFESQQQPPDFEDALQAYQGLPPELL
ncbi:hypothetical protein BDV29DRAFT_162461 [Aspergillus leporis]|uniref:Uncharacterized protein n=1 Tax=Aspergillus leporis TaxID=41062 RepID=A0A5N5WJ87_9EURO|nr:hypothetical protein BDV29DRAFT_162461 [Aspergillus leporis]